MNSFSRFLAGTVALVLLALCLIPSFPTLNCRTEAIDIKTGRIRSTRYVGFFKVSEQIRDSAFTKFVPVEALLKTSAEWRTVTMASPAGPEPQYLFSRAYAQIETLEHIWKFREFDSTAKQRMVQHILALWQMRGSASAAGRYIDSLEFPADEKFIERVKQVIDRLELPQVQVIGEKVIWTYCYPDGGIMERFEGKYNSRNEFVRHGIWETWSIRGRRETYGHFENGQHHGRRFEWDDGGNLIDIETFSHEKPSEYESENLTRHPEYGVARKLFEEPRPQREIQ
jgi:hypothetical protein